MPDWVPVAKGDMHSLVAGGYHYIVDGTGQEELYLYGPDRGESENLAASAVNLARLETMREMLEELTGKRVMAGLESQ